VFENSFVEKPNAFGVRANEQFGEQIARVCETHEHQRYAQHGIKYSQYLARIRLGRYIAISLWF
jgi:hypothetical protein